MDDVPRTPTISDIQSSTSRDERSNECQLCQKQHDLWKPDQALASLCLVKRAEMQIKWMCGISMKHRNTSEELRRLVGVEPIRTVIRSGRLIWYGHVMRKNDEDWVKKCIEGHG